jgi:hypothetical protein
MLANSVQYDYPWRMMRQSAIGRFLGILAIVGLAVAPVARPAMAMPVGSAASDQAAPDEAAMMEDMPCCPKKSPIPDCCKDCLCVGMCALQFPCNAVQGASLAAPFGLAVVLFPGNDTDRIGLRQRPPPRPPKIQA